MGVLECLVQGREAWDEAVDGGEGEDASTAVLGG
jgi:hypothetical protein